MAVVGLDLGGSKIQGVLLDTDHVGDDGALVAGQVKVATPRDGVGSVVAALADCVHRLSDGGRIDGIGLGTPGVVDPDSGIVLKAPNLEGFDSPVPLAELVSGAVGDAMRVAIDNDVNVATVAEHRRGAGQGCDDLLGVFVGTGVGGGLVLDGRLRRGPSGGAGEIGHIVVQPGGRRCGCGLDGHLEAYAGRASLEREARRRAAEGRPTKLVDLAGAKRMKSGIFAKAVHADDEVALELVEEAVDALGIALAAVVALVDVERIVLGGGLGDKLGPSFVERVATATSSLAFTGGPVDVVPAALGDLAGAVGAALLVL